MRLAITDAGLRKENIDGIVTRGSDISPMDLAEYMGLQVGFCEGVTQHGASGAHTVPGLLDTPLGACYGGMPPCAVPVRDF
jgi:hypothetical protein